MTSVVSATLGMVGGTLLLAIMAQYLRMEVLVPVHGAFQLSSNVTRAWFLRSAIQWPIVFKNLAGVLIGAIVGSFFVLQVDKAKYNLVLGLFIIAITILPKFRIPIHFRGRWLLLGVVTSFIGLFMGAVGLIVGAVFLASQIPKQEMVSTQAACQSSLHLIKILTYMSLGFVLSDWGVLIAGGLAMTLLGSWFGTKILGFIPEKIFRFVLTAIVLFLAARLIYQGTV